MEFSVTQRERNSDGTDRLQKQQFVNALKNRCFKKNHKFHQKTFALESFHKATPTQVLSCEIFEIFEKTVFHRTPPVADSGIIKNWNSISVLRFRAVSCVSNPQKQPSRGVLGKAVLKVCNKFTVEHPFLSAISIKLFYLFFFCKFAAYTQNILRTPLRTAGLRRGALLKKGL